MKLLSIYSTNLFSPIRLSSAFPRFFHAPVTDHLLCSSSLVLLGLARLKPRATFELRELSRLRTQPKPCYAAAAHGTGREMAKLMVHQSHYSLNGRLNRVCSAREYRARENTRIQSINSTEQNKCHREGVSLAVRSHQKTHKTPPALFYIKTSERTSVPHGQTRNAIATPSSAMGNLTTNFPRSARCIGRPNQIRPPRTTAH